MITPQSAFDLLKKRVFDHITEQCRDQLVQRLLDGNYEKIQCVVMVTRSGLLRVLTVEGVYRWCKPSQGHWMEIDLKDYQEDGGC